jgi:hypothetical protein
MRPQKPGVLLVACLLWLSGSNATHAVVINSLPTLPSGNSLNAYLPGNFDEPLFTSEFSPTTPTVFPPVFGQILYGTPVVGSTSYPLPGPEAYVDVFYSGAETSGSLVIQVVQRNAAGLGAVGTFVNTSDFLHYREIVTFSTPDGPVVGHFRVEFQSMQDGIAVVGPLLTWPLSVEEADFTLLMPIRNDQQLPIDANRPLVRMTITAIDAIVPVPEPSGWALVATGGIGCLLARRRNQKHSGP